MKLDIICYFISDVCGVLGFVDEDKGIMKI